MGTNSVRIKVTKHIKNLELIRRDLRDSARTPEDIAYYNGLDFAIATMSGMEPKPISLEPKNHKNPPGVIEYEYEYDENETDSVAKDTSSGLYDQRI